MEVTILYTTHRVEILPIFEKYANQHDVIILEEPYNENFEKMLRNEISIQEYVNNVYTEFPIFIIKQCEILRKLYNNGKIIYQIEPYLEALTKIYKAIEIGKFQEALSSDEFIRYVHSIEKFVNEALIKYYDAVLEGDFEKVIETLIEFAKRDAYRIKIRDEIRAKEICKIIEEFKHKFKKILIEAGYIHILLQDFLKKYCNVDTKTINVVKEIANELNISIPPHPGDLLTRNFLLNEDRGIEELKLYAARTVVYTMFIYKVEKVPSPVVKYPHLFNELKVLNFVNKLNYEQCKDLFKAYHKALSKIFKK